MTTFRDFTPAPSWGIDGQRPGTRPTRLVSGTPEGAAESSPSHVAPLTGRDGPSPHPCGGSRLPGPGVPLTLSTNVLRSGRVSLPGGWGVFPSPGRGMTVFLGVA